MAIRVIADLRQRLGGVLKACTEQISKSLMTNEALLNELDRGSGDGDCGGTLKSGTQGESHSTQSGFVWSLFL